MSGIGEAEEVRDGERLTKGVVVEYRNVPPERRVFTFDEAKLAEAMRQEVDAAGRIKRVVVVGGEVGYSGASNPVTGELVLCSDEMVRWAREVYGEVLAEMAGDNGEYSH